MTLSEDSFSEILSESLSGAAGNADDYLLTPALSQRLDLIRHLIEFSRQILLVVGEEGSGKTSLLCHLRDNTPDNWRVATLTSEPMGGAATVIDTLAETFGLQIDSSEDFEQRVQGILTYLRSARQAQMVPVILVDDAHLLPADALLLLLGLAQPEHEAANLRVVLFCDPRIDRMLGSPQLQAFKQSILHTVEMPSFTEDDAAAYVTRFTPGGGAPDEERVRDILNRSGGIPGRIKTLAETGLDTEEDTRNDDGGAPPRIQIRYAAAGAAVALLIGAVLWAWHQSDRKLPGKAVVQPAPVTQPAVSVNPPSVEPPIVPPPAEQRSPPVAQATPAPAAPPAAPETATPKAEAAAPAVTAATPPEAEKLPAPAAATPPKPASPPPQPAKKPEPVAKKPSHKPSAEYTTLKGKSWILKQPGSHYALQLFGSHDHAAAVNFAKTYKLTARSAIYSTVLDKKAFHVVIYGAYRNRSEAAAAAAHLPPQVRILKPFPRSFAEIRKLMARKP
jgi:DamX protein